MPSSSHALVLISATSFSITTSYMDILTVDLYYASPATAMAANNLLRCFLGAAAT